MKKILILGASANPERYSNKLLKRLDLSEFEPIAIGLKKGLVNDIKILDTLPEDNNYYAISIYLSAKNQAPYFSYILNAKVNKVIFNPGAENPELFEKLREKQIEVENACSLVQLSMGIL